jgi:hypothetical protein
VRVIVFSIQHRKYHDGKSASRNNREWIDEEKQASMAPQKGQSESDRG